MKTLCILKRNEIFITEISKINVKVEDDRLFVDIDKGSVSCSRFSYDVDEVVKIMLDSVMIYDGDKGEFYV